MKIIEVEPNVKIERGTEWKQLNSNQIKKCMWNRTKKNKIGTEWKKLKEEPFLKDTSEVNVDVVRQRHIRNVTTERTPRKWQTRRL